MQIIFRLNALITTNQFQDRTSITEVPKDEKFMK
jgi:hypothetical protein